ncbi:hypothetical protein CIPAW_02G182300 [Carya illinoinensis]|uniref:Uncharacterized protein n=1 Tax=Carya illinoinensis TaxID=32201 RepID=A0A8T1RFG2_CARIL|nr:hypothetical protein CIPAW_02G182300 [Carya illinoinensis]
MYLQQFGVHRNHGRPWIFFWKSTCTELDFLQAFVYFCYS